MSLLSISDVRPGDQFTISTPTTSVRGTITRRLAKTFEYSVVYQDCQPPVVWVHRMPHYRLVGALAERAGQTFLVQP